MRQGYVLVGLLITVLTGAVIGIVMFSATSISDMPARVAPIHAVAPSGTIGSVGQIPISGGQHPYTLAWVDELGLSAWNRAYENRDSAAEMRAMELFERLQIPDATMVRVVNRRGNAMQVEVLDGPLSGRRGWLDAQPLDPIP